MDRRSSTLWRLIRNYLDATELVAKGPRFPSVCSTFAIAANFRFPPMSLTNLIDTHSRRAVSVCV